MSTSEVLNTAADLIERDGWTQGAEGMLTSGPHCLQGAIQAAAGAPRWGTLRGEKYHYLAATPCAAGDAVQDYLAVHGSDHVWMWNDERARTASEVVEVLRAVAVIEQARETAAIEVSA